MSAGRDQLDTFGQIVVENLRDRAIEFYDILAAAQWKAPSLFNLQEELKTLGEHERTLLRRCIIAALEHGIHDFLFSLQEDRPGIAHVEIFVDGVSIIPLSDGLQAEIFGEDGWFDRFSKFGVPPDTP